MAFTSVLGSQQAFADSTWNGPYVGGAVGLSQHKADWEDIQEDWYVGTAKVKSSGTYAGIYGGFNWQVDSSRYCIEADLGALSNDSTDNLSAGAYDDITKNDIKYVSTIRGRAGIILDDYLIYATGGIAAAEIHADMNSVDYPSDIYSPSSFKTGWVAGGGVEYKLSNDAGLRFEALYHDFGSDTYEQVDADGNFMKINNTLITARIGYTHYF
ncbi:MAG: porin family protein [Amphritea sp.]|nr:porin family protein [Amphritea sp.]